MLASYSSFIEVSVSARRPFGDVWVVPSCAYWTGISVLLENWLSSAGTGVQPPLHQHPHTHTLISALFPRRSCVFPTPRDARWGRGVSLDSEAPVTVTSQRSGASDNGIETAAGIWMYKQIRWVRRHSGLVSGFCSARFMFISTVDYSTQNTSLIWFFKQKALFQIYRVLVYFHTNSHSFYSFFCCCCVDPFLFLCYFCY